MGRLSYNFIICDHHMWPLIQHTLHFNYISKSPLFSRELLHIEVYRGLNFGKKSFKPVCFQTTLVLKYSYILVKLHICLLETTFHSHCRCRCVMKCSRFYCYFNLEIMTKISCRVVQFIQCPDVTSTSFQMRMFNKQNIILLICKFACLLLVSMQITWKTDFALFNIRYMSTCPWLFLHYLALEVKPIWLIQAEICDLHLDFFGIYAL